MDYHMQRLLLRTSCIDVLDNKLEEMLVQERQEYSNLFNQCPEALVYTDVDGIIKYSSEQFENLTGYKSEEIRGDSIFYCLKPIDRDSFNMANKRDFETTIFGRNNTPIEVSIRKNSNQINIRKYFQVVQYFFHFLNRDMKKRLFLLFQVAMYKSYLFPESNFSAIHI